VEPTEEIRVAWMELCVTLINELTAPVKNSMTEEQVMELIQVAGQDPFSEVLKRAAKLIILYARYQPKAVDYACDRMIRLTIPLLTHKHTAVRVLGIKVMEPILYHSRPFFLLSIFSLA
jgi:dynein assembly factor 5